MAKLNYCGFRKFLPLLFFCFFMLEGSQAFTQDWQTLIYDSSKAPVDNLLQLDKSFYLAYPVQHI